MRARVDAGHCVGHGQCAANAPDVFVLDDLGNAISPRGGYSRPVRRTSSAGSRGVP